MKTLDDFVRLLCEAKFDCGHRNQRYFKNDAGNWARIDFWQGKIKFALPWPHDGGIMEFDFKDVDEACDEFKRFYL